MRTEQPRPPVTSTLAVGGTVYLGCQEPHLTKTSWDLERHMMQKPPEIIQPKLPVRLFNGLPREVYECIITQLEHMHLAQGQPCPACHLRDLHSLCLVSRAWDKAITPRMYRRVFIITNENHTKLPKLNIRGTSRLKLLRRTLRDRSTLARYVRELHMSDVQTLHQNATIEQEQIVSLVASVVMACPKLERLVGFHTPFTLSFDRLAHALSTRRNLKERVWRLNDFKTNSSDEEDDEYGAYYFAARDPTERFLELNSNHPMLSTLVLQDHSQNDTTLSFRAIIGALRGFPSLRNLSLSGLSSGSFTNLTLNALPSNLHSLRLEDLPGIDDKGIQRFATSHAMKSLESLLLIDLEISSLVTISNILSTRSAKLDAFSLAQYRAPRLYPGSSLPHFASRTLQYLHWEIRSDAGPLPKLPLLPSHDYAEESSSPFKIPEPIACLATSLLAANIIDGAFPSLQRIRIPHDPQGLIQALCKPLATALLPYDIITGSDHVLPSNNTCTSTFPKTFDFVKQDSSPRADSAFESPTLVNRSSSIVLTPARSRLAAQARILAARKAALMTVRDCDPDGDGKVKKITGGFLGQIDSQITYDLQADKGRTFNAVLEEQNGWITSVDDLIDAPIAENAQLLERSRVKCEHRKGEKEWKGTVMAEELF
ncbi:hypothetical protein BDU57DRAFT_509307 [Ampelomyces quisqualis]|uniref:F-box domain-containing protein n=1 Tax=Ampelomyces quisqualis TaxID=50730 RepID=A0A6A5QYJ7_AMPQU|nr:hypothetical protein BDU57DRAFT_509307 [Ampelomyces quisqualis]